MNGFAIKCCQSHNPRLRVNRQIFCCPVSWKTFHQKFGTQLFRNANRSLVIVLVIWCKKRKSVAVKLSSSPSREKQITLSPFPTGGSWSFQASHCLDTRYVSWKNWKNFQVHIFGMVCAKETAKEFTKTLLAKYNINVLLTCLGIDLILKRVKDTIYQPLRSGRIWHKVNF